jgi:hypothetical protein
MTRPWARAAWIALAILMLAGQTRGSDNQDALLRARDKFRQAISLQTGGDWAGALSLLRQVAEVKATPQVRFNIALCEENLGQLVAALGSYQLAIAEGQPTDGAQVAVEAEQRLESLKARIPKVVIERGEGADLARISLDGVVVGATLVGKPLPVDPGPHVVEANAAGYSTFRETFRVDEKEERFVRIRLTALTTEAASAQTSTALPEEHSAERGPSRSIWPWVVGGAGLASLAAAGVFFTLRADTVDELDATCGGDRDRCPRSAEDTIARGETYTTLGNVTLIAGVALVGTAATLWVVESRSGARVGVSPSAALASAGMRVVGQF